MATPATAEAIVSVEVTSGQVLTITGTSDDDHILVTESAPGQLLLQPGSNTALDFLNGCVEVMDGGGGTGVAECTGVAEIIANLKAGNDFVVVKSSLPAELRGDGGDDELRGGSGNDELYGAGGDDVIGGGEGQDKVRGGDGNDELYGNKGDDDIKGEAGHDRIDGGDGDDVIDGGGGDDYLFGFSGDDIIGGGPGNDHIDGGDDQDDLSGNGGDDTLFGGAGVDQINGGPGSDTVEQDPPAPLVDVETYGGIQNAVALGGGTTLAVANGTLAFNDPHGNANEITVIEDPVVPGALFVTDASQTPFVLGPGCTASGSSYMASCTGAQDLYLEGGAGNDVLEVSVLITFPSSLSGGTGYDKLLGGGGADVLDGGSQADVLDGREGADELYGGEGDDRISGGLGVAPDADLLFGGPGFDSATYYDRLSPVSVTFDTQHNDGYSGEGDYVALDIESRGTNFVADDGVLDPGSELLVFPFAWSTSDPLFHMSTRDDVQVVAFYEQVFDSLPNQHCFLTIGARDLGSSTWSLKQLDWREDPDGSPLPCQGDTHYNIRISIDRHGFLHVAAAHHNDPMRYFRTAGSILNSPAEIQTLTRHPVIDWPGYEPGVTYPQFYETQNGTLMMTYRQDGNDGGPIRASVFDPNTETWSYVPDGALFGTAPTGGDAYREEYRRDGRIHHFARFFHGGAMQSQALVYARTQDGHVYENAAGTPLSLPITNVTSEAHIEFNSEGGIRRFDPSFDSTDSPMVGYLVYDNDENGNYCPGGQKELKSRFAVLRNGQWLKKDLKCTDFVWVLAGPKFLDPAEAWTFFQTVPEERLLNGQRVYVVSTTVGNTPYGIETEHFVLDWESLDILAQQGTDPGGEVAVIDWSDQCAEPDPFVPATPVPPGISAAKWATKYEPGVGDTDAADFYRLLHEVVTGPWGVATDPTPVRVKRLACDKTE